MLVVDYADMLGLEQMGGKLPKWEALQAMWEELRARRPEDPRVEAYLALLSRSDVETVPATVKTKKKKK